MKYAIMLLLSAFVLIGCSDQEGQPSNHAENIKTAETENSTYAKFRNIDVKTKDQQIHLTGEANSTENEVFYQLSQGEQIIGEETAITMDEGHLDWVEFEITLKVPKDAEKKQDPPIIRLYGKDSTGAEINPNYVPVDLN